MEAQRQRAAPKSAFGRKKTAGSDFSSIRGSEERHSSVPVTGRGTKRGRDMDLDKVGQGFSSASFLLDIQHFEFSEIDLFGHENVLDSDYYNTYQPSKRQKQALSAHYFFGLDGTGEEPPAAADRTTTADPSTGEIPPGSPSSKQTTPDVESSVAPGGRKTSRVRVKTSKGREFEAKLAGSKAGAAAKVTKPKPKPKPKRVAALKREASVEGTAAPVKKPKVQRRQTPESASREDRKNSPADRPEVPQAGRKSAAVQTTATTSEKGPSKERSLPSPPPPPPPSIEPTIAQPGVENGPSVMPPDSEETAIISTEDKSKQTSTTLPKDGPKAAQSGQQDVPPDVPSDYHRDDKWYEGRINGSKQEEAFHSRPAVRLPIPDHLKALLVDDWENVTKNLSLVPLPSAHPVNEILTAYLEEEKLKRRPGSAEWDLVEEVVAGLKEYFDQTLGRILLYRFEREQYFQVRKKMEKGDAKFMDKTASDIYGAEHLCRLFGELISFLVSGLSL